MIPDENIASLHAPAVPLSRMLTLREVADLLQLSLAHLRREIRQRRLPAHRLGRAIRISEADLADYLGRRRRGPR